MNYREKGCKGTRPCNVVDAEQEQSNTFDHVTSDEDWHDEDHRKG